MKACILEGNQSLSIIELEIEEPHNDELVVAVKTLGLCGSDLKTYNDENPMVVFPVIPGHEIGCEVIAKGDEVTEDIRIGDRGTVLPYTSCRICPACSSKRFNTCSGNRTLGVARDGAAREFLTIKADDFILCREMDFSDIALIEPLSVGRHAAARAGDVSGKRVLLYGLGIIGIGVLLELKKQGAHVIVAELSEIKLKLAKKLGADQILNIGDPDYQDQLDTMASAFGINIVIDAVGASSVVSAAIHNCSVAGAVILIGYHSDTFPFNSKLIVSKELSVLGSRNALISDFIAVRDFLKENSNLKETLITKRFNLIQLEDAFKYWNKEKNYVTKILIDV